MLCCLSLRGASETLFWQNLQATPDILVIVILYLHAKGTFPKHYPGFLHWESWSQNQTELKACVHPSPWLGFSCVVPVALGFLPCRQPWTSWHQAAWVGSGCLAPSHHNSPWRFNSISPKGDFQILWKLKRQEGGRLEGLQLIIRPQLLYCAEGWALQNQLLFRDGEQAVELPSGI